MYKRQEYNSQIYQALLEIYKSANSIDYSIELSYVKNKKEIVKHILWNKTEKDKATFSKKLQSKFKHKNKILNRSLKKLLVHRWVIAKIKEYKTLEELEKDNTLFNVFRNKNASNFYKMLKMRDNKKKIKLYLQASIIKFLTKESEKHIDYNQYELKYINKTN